MADISSNKQKIIRHGDTILLKNLMIEMKDGVLLSADTYLPSEWDIKQNQEQKYPAVLEYIPYRKDEACWDQRFSENLAKRGYAVVRVDCRGTGSSGGTNTDEYSLQEQEDGCLVIDWIASQPWCDGQVNMMGISYGGFTALQIAAKQPKNLKTIIPVDFTDNRYTDDCIYTGGLVRMYYNISMYGTQMIAYNAMPPSKYLDEEYAQKIWHEHLDSIYPYFFNWFSHPEYDDYWKNGSVSECSEKIKCPVFLIGAWRDGYPNCPFRLFEKLQSPKKVLIGPWNHSWPNKAIPGPRIDYLEEVQRWLDYWCKGLNTGIMDEPNVQYYIQKYQKPTANRMETEGYWTTNIGSISTKHQLFYLEGHTLSPTPGNGIKQTIPSYPNVGLESGLWSGGIRFGLPGDHRNDEGKMNVFTSEILQEDVVIMGRPSITIHMDSIRSEGCISAFLCEVGKDGSSIMISRGIKNISLDEKGFYNKSVSNTISVELDHTAWHFSKGNQIRLCLAQNDFPNFWPLPHNCKLDICCDDGTYLTLPVIQPNNSTRRFNNSPTCVSPIDTDPLLPIWESSYDHIRDLCKVRILYDSDFITIEDVPCKHTMASEFILPVYNQANCSAKGKCICTQKKEKGEVIAESTVNMFSDSESFHFEIYLVVTNCQIKVFEKKWIKSFPRHGK